MDLSDLAYMRGHLHLTFRVPVADGILQLIPGYSEEKVQADIDIKFVDRDDDGDANFELRWDLPGTALDSGENPVEVKLPKTDLTGVPLKDSVSSLLEKANAPGVVVAGIKKLMGG